MTLIKEIKKTPTKDKMIIVLIAILIVAIGIYAANQYASFKYKATLIQEPCNLCAEKNPSIKDCILYRPVNNIINITSIKISP